MEEDELFLNMDKTMVSHQGLDRAEVTGIMKDLINTEAVITAIDYGLQGMMYNPQKGEWEKVEGQEQVKITLRFKIINALRARLNTVTLFANIDQEMIEKICYYLHMDIAELLLKNPDQIYYNEQLDSDVWTRASLIHSDIMDAVWIGLTQPQGGGQRELLKKIGSWTESRVTTGQPQQRKKFLGII